MKKIFTLVIAILVIAFASEAQNTWTQKADFGGTTRYAATGFSIGNKGYIGTGDNNLNTLVKDFWEYNPITNVWTQKADFGGTARWFAVGFSIGGFGYIGTGSEFNSTNFKNDFWQYDPATNTWTQKADFSGGARDEAVGFSVDSKGYIGTGAYYDGNQWLHKTDFWEYDPATDSWEKKADFGGGEKDGAVGFSINSKGYIGVGMTSGTVSKNFWEYDPTINTWIQKADFGGAARTWATGFSIGSKGYIGTGNDGLNFPMKDFWEYDPVANAWTQKTDFGGTARYLAAGFSIGIKGYIVTGTSYTKDFWEYTPESDASLPTNLTIGHTCPGTLIDVPFTASGFNAGNIFTAQLSDANGDFASPVDIGTLAAISSGAIGATIPSSTTFSQHYRIRVVASDPATIGTDNGNDITITCPKPKGLFVKHVTSTKATLSWHESGCNATFTFAFRKGGTNYWSTLNTSYDFMILNGLMPSSTYFWKVRTVCALGVFSEWSPKESFNTLPVKLEDANDDALESLNLFPNPTAGTFTLDLKLNDEENSEAIIQVINMLGQVVYDETTSVANGVLQKEIQLSDAADGMYLVKVTINNQVFSSQINYQKQ